MTTPGAQAEPTSQYVDPLDDVFGSAPASPALAAQTHNANDGTESLNAPSSRPGIADYHSDVPRLRSIHVTNGYREGIAASKEQHIQAGFDEGYSLGAEVALKAGYLLGAIEGVRRALAKEVAVDSLTTGEGGDTELVEMKEEVRKMLEAAEEELKVETLFGEEHFGEDGSWIYDVPGQEDEGEVTFAKVAEAHPVVKKWRVRLQELCKRLDLDLG